MKQLRYLLIVTLLSFPAIVGVNQTATHPKNALSSAPTSRDVITGMLGAIDKTRTLQYTFKSYERLKDGKTFYTEMEMKVQVSPVKVYGFTKSDPNKGVEVLYVTGKWENKALVNPGKWLPNVKLSPYGDRMRENQHHTILDSGFGLLADIIRNAMSKADTEKPGEFNSIFQYEGDITWEGRACYKISINDPTFAYVDYTVQPGDNIDNIARRKFICGYLIIEKNPSVKDWESLKPGMKIKIPSSYAKKTILYIDKRNYLPVVQIMHDEAGQFEKYEFHNLKVNPVFKDNEFTPEFEGYDF